MTYKDKAKNALPWIVIPALAGLLYYLYHYNPSGLVARDARKTSIQPLKITSHAWTGVKIDPEKESFDLNPVDTDIDVQWLVVINKDFNNPIPIGRKGSTMDMGNGIKNLDITLVKPRSADFILKRIPK